MPDLHIQGMSRSGEAVGRYFAAVADWELLAYTSKGAGGDHTQVTTDPIDTTGAELIILGLSNFDTDPTLGMISDSKGGNTWHITTTYGSSGGRVALFWTIPTSVGSGHTFTISGGAVNIYPAVGVMAFRSNVGTPSDDAQTGNSNSGITTINYNTPITPSEDGELIVSLLGTQGDEGSTPAISLGMTLQNSLVYSSGNYLGMHMAWKIQTTAASFNPSWSWTNSISAETVILSFKKS